MVDADKAYLAALGAHGRVIDSDVSSVDRLGVSVTSAVLLVDGQLAHLGNGYGAEPGSAHVSGLGELAEGVFSAVRVAELAAASRRQTHTEILAGQGAERVVDPRWLCLPAGSGWTPDRPLTWVEVDRVRTGESVWVPIEFVASEPAEVPDVVPLITPVTNGLGAGLDRDRALAHGVLEILQRHTNGLRFRALDRRSAVVRPDGLPAGVRALVDQIEGHGVQLVIKHAATTYGVCSTYVMGIDPSPSSPLQVTACGEAAHPSAEVSLRKAILEYANSRARKTFCFGDPEVARPLAPADYWAAVAVPYDGGERRATEAMQAWGSLPVDELRRLTAPDTSTMIDYAAITTSAPDLASSADLLAYLLDQLGDHDVLATTIEADGVHVAKVIIPGLEVETLSYGRIGEANVVDLLGTDLDLVRRASRPTATHPDRILLTPAAEERLGGPVWYSRAAADRVVGSLYPLYREPRRHTVRVG